MLARYCVKDSVLPLLLLDKLKLLYNNIALARATGLPLQRLLDRGQSLRAFNAIRYEAFRRGWLVPDKIRDYTAPQTSGADRKEKGYSGAVVIQPLPGYYEQDWVLTYDFNSLYPSIIIAFAICYTTLIPKRWVAAMQAAGYAQEPDSNGNVFLRRQIRAGIVATCVKKFLTDRSKAKALMAKAHNEGDKLAESIYNALQDALKLCANGTYGFLGLTRGKLPSVEAASAVTARGRDLIIQTKNLIEQVNPDKNWPGGVVVYGDTDSVFVKLLGAGVQGLDVKEVMKLGTIGEKIINDHFKSLQHLKVVLEKGFRPLLLISKKRYAGWKFVVDPSAPTGISESLSISGLEAVRRDNPIIMNESFNTILKYLCNKQPKKEEAKHIACEVVEQILTRSLPISKLVETKGLTKVNYKSAVPHVVVNEKKRKREGEGAAYRLGERIPFVILDGPGLSAARAEDPDYAEAHDLPISTEYYLNRVQTPYRRIFDLVYREGFTVKHIFNGPHTKKRKLPSLRNDGGAASKNTLAAFGFFSTPRVKP